MQYSRLFIIASLFHACLLQAVSGTIMVQIIQSIQHQKVESFEQLLQEHPLTQEEITVLTNLLGKALQPIPRLQKKQTQRIWSQCGLAFSTIPIFFSASTLASLAEDFMQHGIHSTQVDAVLFRHVRAQMPERIINLNAKKLQANRIAILLILYGIVQGGFSIYKILQIEREQEQLAAKDKNFKKMLALLEQHAAALATKS